MKKALITGATGMIGNIILKKCLASADISEVISIVRQTSTLAHEKLTEIIHQDFTDFTTLHESLIGIDVCFFCIGVYTGAVPDDRFKVITVDYTKALADQLIKLSPRVTFCFLSGQGADKREKSRMAFARYKGMAENYLISLPFDQLAIFRPAYIYPVEHRKEPNFSYQLMRLIYPAMKAIYPKGAITSEELGAGMYMAGMAGADKAILENQDIKALL